MEATDKSLTFLLQRLNQKDEKAFHILYTRYADDVYGFSRSIVKSDSLAKEILQEVFLTIWVKSADIQPDLNFKSYLLTITKNKSLNLLKKAANDQALAEQMSHKGTISGHNPFDLVYEKDLIKVKQNALKKLPEKRRRIFLMSREEGKSYNEISEELNISVNTVKVQMTKALSTLREYFSHHPDITFSIFLLLITSF